MNRRGFFKRTVGAGLGLLGIQLLPEAEEQQSEPELEEGNWYGLNVTCSDAGTSTNTCYVYCWGSDEPDIYTWEDGVPV